MVVLNYSTNLIVVQRTLVKYCMVRIRKREKEGRREKIGKPKPKTHNSQFIKKPSLSLLGYRGTLLASGAFRCLFNTLQSQVGHPSKQKTKQKSIQYYAPWSITCIATLHRDLECIKFSKRKEGKVGKIYSHDLGRKITSMLGEWLAILQVRKTSPTHTAVQQADHCAASRPPSPLVPGVPNRTPP